MANVGSSILPESQGSPFYAVDTRTSTTASVQTLITFVVPVAVTRRLEIVKISYPRDARYEIFADSVRIGGGILQPGMGNDQMVWKPIREVAAGVTIKVDFTADSSKPDTVDTFLMASDI